MKHFYSSVRREETPKGVLTHNKKVSAKISPVNIIGELKMKFRPLNEFKSSVTRHETPFGTGVKRLSVRYTFFDVLSRIRMIINPNISTAPATEVEADRVVDINTTAPLSTHPAVEMKAIVEEKLSVTAKPVSYRKAIGLYIRNIVTNLTANSSSADGFVVGVQDKTITMNRVSEGFISESVPISYRQEIDQPEHKSVSISAEGICIEESKLSTMETSAIAVPSTIKSVDVDTCQSTVCSATVSLWICPEVIDGELMLNQVYEAYQQDDILEVI